MSKLSIIFTFILLIFFCATSPLALRAQESGSTAQTSGFGKFEVGLPGIPSDTTIDSFASDPEPILKFINLATNAVIAILVIIGLISITVGGYLYMTAAGNGKQIETAKEIIIAALAGIFLALISVVILNTINNYLGKDAKEPTLGPVEGSALDSPSGAMQNFNSDGNSFENFEDFDSSGGSFEDLDNPDSFGSPDNLPTL